MEKINFRKAKFSGIIGSSLSIIGCILTSLSLSIIDFKVLIPIILFVVASILILFAISDISKKTRVSKIFSFYLIGLILFIVGIILHMSLFRGPKTSNFGSVLIFTIFSYVIIVVSAYCTKKSFDIISIVLNNHYFKTVSWFIFICTVSIVILPYNFVVLIRVIFEIVVFISIPSEFEKEECSQKF
ncbi:MAG: hypothetical protein PHQ76_03395 [Caldisericia bacterium]|nr:hypothetical protein [Caldisericia bacterium]HOJ16605.1 hypothetical protein [Caldisericia bacterium]HOW03025.1 hypothetical protein [Caldisericia bacterium]HPO29090.1 hypothetical protein [Caldisericia bacterium]